MNPGDLNQRGELLGLTSTADGYGGFTENWTVLQNIWAKVQPVTRSEGVEGGSLVLRRYLRLTIRRSTEVTNDRRIRLEGRDYNIVSIGLPGPTETVMMIEVEAVET